MPRLTIAILALTYCQLALAETIVLKQRVSIPTFIGGKKVGSSGAPIGSELEVLARDGTLMQVKFRNLEPVWIESSIVEAENPSEQVKEGASTSTNTTEQLEGKSEERRNETYAGLNEKAIWSIEFWDKDGDDLLAWTDNFMSQSGLSSEDASELVKSAVDNLGILPSDRIESLGGRAKAYQDRLNEDLRHIKAGDSGHPRWKKYGPEGSKQRAAQATPSKYHYANKYSAETAMDVLTKAADEGDPEAQYELAVGNFQKDEAKALNLLMKSAEAGYAPAQNQISSACQFGDFSKYGLSRNSALALEWLRKATEQRYPPALWKLAAYYSDGNEELGIEQNPEKAFELFSDAADQGYVLAQLDLAAFYSEGRVVKRDWAKAFQLYLQAAEQGDALAQRQVADCYKWGNGVSRDPEQAAKWLAKAEETKAKRSKR